MLDEKDLQAIHTMMEQQKKEILKESMANMQVIIENTFAPQFKLLFEKLDSMGSKMIPQEAMDIMPQTVPVSGAVLLFVHAFKSSCSV